MQKMFRVLVIFLLVVFLSCNTDSGETQSSSEPVNTIESTSQTEGASTSNSTIESSDVNVTNVITTSTVVNDQVQGFNVPTPPDFGLGF